MGADRARLLNGLVTCDVAALAPGRGAQGFFTDIKGHVLAEMVVLVGDDSLWLRIDRSVVESIASHIERYILADRVEVRAHLEQAAVTLLGPEANARATDLLGVETEALRTWSHRLIEVGTEPVRVMADGHYGIPAITLAASVAAIEQITRSLRASAAAESPIEIRQEIVDTIRIEEGVPAFGCDYDTDNLPQETGIESAIDYDKGCYLGQEVVARLHYRGQVARRVTRLRGEGKHLPEVGSPLVLDNREGGTLTSVARRPGGDQISALAVLQRRCWEPGTRLVLADGETMRVVS